LIKKNGWIGDERVRLKWGFREFEGLWRKNRKMRGINT
jgi:hypothetical protein